MALNEHKELFHLGFDPNKYNAKYAIIPGAPERTDKIAECLDSATFIGMHREYKAYIGKIGCENVFVCSTGIGGPSAAIAVEELYRAGVRYFIRVGTCGGIQYDIKSGDLVIANSAVRQEGTALEYAPIEYPATADFDVTSALVSAAQQQGYTYHVGVVQSKDSFYGQHDPDASPVSTLLHQKWNAWKQLGVLASEMECASVFTVAASLGAKAGAVLHCVWNQEREAAGVHDSETHNTDCAVKCAVQAIRNMI